MILYILMLLVFVLFLYWFFVEYLKPIKTKVQGTWVIVSGCTSGIGKSFAELLASKGYNIVCISRSEEKLKSISKMLECDYNVKTMSIICDFSRAENLNETEILNKLDVIKDEICILINSVGMSYVYPEKLENLSNEFIFKLINTNIYSCTFLSKLFIKISGERQCILVNFSSMLSNIPAPLLSVYSATKSFVKKFTSNIGLENKNIRCISLSPYFVSTEMTRFKPNTLIPTPEEYVFYALKDIQCSDSRDLTGYFYHTVILNVLRCIPKNILGDIIFSKLNSFKEIYKLKYR